MNTKIIKLLGVVVGLILISFGLLVVGGVLPNTPKPEWLYGSVMTFFGVAFFSYGVSGKSRILGIK